MAEMSFNSMESKYFSLFNKMLGNWMLPFIWSFMTIYITVKSQDMFVNIYS